MIVHAFFRASAPEHTALGEKLRPVVAQGAP